MYDNTIEGNPTESQLRGNIEKVLNGTPVSINDQAIVDSLITGLIAQPEFQTDNDGRTNSAENVHAAIRDIPRVRQQHPNAVSTFLLTGTDPTNGDEWLVEARFREHNYSPFYVPNVFRLNIVLREPPASPQEDEARRTRTTGLLTRITDTIQQAEEAKIPPKPKGIQGLFAKKSPPSPWLDVGKNVYRPIFQKDSGQSGSSSTTSYC